MLPSLLFTCVLACLASAQNISFFFPGGYDGVDPVASIESVGPSVTQFRIACPSGTSSDQCGWGPGVEYSIISKTSYKASVSYDSSNLSLGCNYNSQSTRITCSASIVGASLSNELRTVTLSGSDVTFIQASVVSGASLLSSTPTASTTMTAATSGSRKLDAGPTATATSKNGAAARSRIDTSTICVLVGVVIMSLQAIM